jgi:hypothetical protein
MKLVLLLFPLLLAAQMLHVGDSITPATLEDQYEAEHKIGNERYWIITWDKESTHMINTYFEAHPNTLKNQNAAMLVDVSQIPSAIFSLFVKPRLKDYKHPILLSFDTEYNRALPYQEGTVTLLELNKGVIRAITFVADEAALAKALPEVAKKDL